jgi:rhamnosyltransferase
MVARELTQVFARLAHDDLYISNVNAAYRRACWEEIRFRDVGYAEDQAFGRDLQGTAWAKAFAPAAGVHHAHDYGLLGFWRRSFDEARGLREATGWIEPFTLRATLGGIRRQVGRDVRWMRRQRWPLASGVAWTARSIVHHSGRKAFAWLGSRSERLPARVRRTLSLEGRAD